MRSGSPVLIMSAWRRAIPREPGADTDSVGSGPVPTPINLGQPVGHWTHNVVALTTIQEMSLDKAGAPRDIVKPKDRRRATGGGGRYNWRQRGALTGALGEVTGKSVPKGLCARDRMEREMLLLPVGMVRGGRDQDALVSNPEAGAMKDQDLEVESLVLEKLNPVLDRCLPEFCSRSFEDPDRT